MATPMFRPNACKFRGDTYVVGPKGNQEAIGSTWNFHTLFGFEKD